MRRDLDSNATTLLPASRGDTDTDSASETANLIHPPCQPPGRPFTPPSTQPNQPTRFPTDHLSKKIFHSNQSSSSLPIHRFAHSSLHQRDPRNDLFKGYSGSSASERRSANASPARYGGGGAGYGYGGGVSSGGYNGSGYNGSSSTLGVERGGFRSATPNSKGQYSDAVLNELESQNDEQVEGIMGKVKILKDARFFLSAPPTSTHTHTLPLFLVIHAMPYGPGANKPSLPNR